MGESFFTSWSKHNTLKFRQPRAPHAIATRMSHIWYHANRHEQWNRVTQPLFFHEGSTAVGLALAPKMCPDQSQVFKGVNNSQAFTMGRGKNDEPLPGAPRHACTKLRENIRRTDCKGPILSNIYRPKSNMHQNQTITMRCRDCCLLPHKSQNVHAVFER